MNELRSKLQTKLEEHFNKFIKVQINDTDFDVMAPQHKVPKIVSADYKNDVLEIHFQNKENFIHTLNFDKDTLVYLDSDKNVAGIEVHNFSALVLDHMHQQFETFKKKQIDSYTSHRITLLNTIVEQKKYNFFEDVMLNKNQIMSTV